MNITHLEHVVFALLMQAAFGLFGGWWIGAAWSAAFFISREHAQRESELARDVNVLTPWQGFFGWSKDALLDALLPTIAVIVTAVLITL